MTENEDWKQKELEYMACSIDELYTFFVDVSTRWMGMENRILGHLVLAPPIGSVARGYNEDWVAIGVDASKVKANVRNFYSPHFPSHFSTKMHNIMPNYMRNSDGWLGLNHVLPDEALRHTMVVCKRGAGSGFTVGRANNVFSFTHTRLRGDRQV